MDGGKLNLKHELEHIERISDMMVSMHSALRDQYAFRSAVIDCLLFIPAIILAAFAFVDLNTPLWLHWGVDSTRIFIGCLSLVAFLFSLINFRVDWKAKSELHKRAAEVYSQMKLDSKKMLAVFDQSSESNIRELLTRYSDLGSACIAIPENKFLTLKQKHKMKVLISRYLDRNPAYPLFILKIRLFLSPSHMQRELNKNEPIHKN
jgi:hypothetical protein